MASVIDRLDLSTMELEKATFEIRYKDAYLLWDHAGTIWDTIVKNRESVQRREVKPDKVTILIDNKYDLSISIDKAFVIAHYPSADLSGLKELAGLIVSLLSEFLHISFFSRIGFRSIYASKEESKEAASSHVCELYKLPITREEKIFNIEGTVIEPKISYVWRAKNTAIRVSIESQTRTLDFTPPPDTTLLKPVQDETSYFVMDFDYFTEGEILLSQLRVSDWIDQALHIIRRDAKKLG